MDKPWDAAECWEGLSPTMQTLVLGGNPKGAGSAGRALERRGVFKMVPYFGTDVMWELTEKGHKLLKYAQSLQKEASHG